MKKGSQAESDTLRVEYRRGDLGEGVRGKHLDAYRRGSNVVLLSPDVAKAFPTSESVNEALRAAIQLVKQTEAPPRRKRAALDAGARR